MALSQLAFTQMAEAQHPTCAEQLAADPGSFTHTCPSYNLTATSGTYKEQADVLCVVQGECTYEGGNDCSGSSARCNDVSYHWLQSTAIQGGPWLTTCQGTPECTGCAAPALLLGFMTGDASCSNPIFWGPAAGKNPTAAPGTTLEGFVADTTQKPQQEIQKKKNVHVNSKLGSSIR